MSLNQKNTKKQGDVGVGVAIGLFASRGYTVCIPLSDSQEYDLIVDIDGKLCRVQVKTSRGRSRWSKGFEVQLRTNGGNQSWSGVSKKFDRSKVDYLFILTADGDQYLIPSEYVKGASSITVGNENYEEFLVFRDRR